jgi:hypothetical protein
MGRVGFNRGSSGDVVADIASNAALSNMGGFISLRPSAKYMSGARTTIKINDRIMSFAFSVSWDIETELTEIRTVDELRAYEFGPRKISVSGTVGSWVLPGESPQINNIQANALSFIFDKYVTIEVRDSVTDNIIFRTNNAMFSRSRGSLARGTLGNMELSWRAIEWINEESPKYPDRDDTNTSPKPPQTSFSPGNKKV